MATTGFGTAVTDFLLNLKLVPYIACAEFDIEEYKFPVKLEAAEITKQLNEIFESGDSSKLSSILESYKELLGKSIQEGNIKNLDNIITGFKGSRLPKENEISNVLLKGENLLRNLMKREEKIKQIIDSVGKAVQSGNTKKLNSLLDKFRKELCKNIVIEDRYMLEAYISGFKEFTLPEEHGIVKDLEKAVDLLNQLTAKKGKIKEIMLSYEAAMQDNDKQKLTFLHGEYNRELKEFILCMNKHMIEGFIEGFKNVKVPSKYPLSNTLVNAEALLSKIRVKEEKFNSVVKDVNNALKKDNKEKLKKLMEKYRKEINEAIKEENHFKLEGIIEGFKFSDLPEEHEFSEDLNRAETFLENMKIRDDKQKSIVVELNAIILEDNQSKMDVLLLNYQEELSKATAEENRPILEAFVEAFKSVQMPDENHLLANDLSNAKSLLDSLRAKDAKKDIVTGKVNKAIKEGEKALQDVFLNLMDELKESVKQGDRHKIEAIIEGFKASDLQEGHEYFAQLDETAGLIEKLKWKEEKQRYFVDKINQAKRNGGDELDTLLNELKEELFIAMEDEDRYQLEAIIGAFKDVQLPEHHALSKDLKEAEILLQKLIMKEEKENEIKDKLGKALQSGNRHRMDKVLDKYRLELKEAVDILEKYRLELKEAVKVEDKYRVEAIVKGLATLKFPDDHKIIVTLGSAFILLDRIKMKEAQIKQKKISWEINHVLKEGDEEKNSKILKKYKRIMVNAVNEGKDKYCLESYYHGVKLANPPAGQELQNELGNVENQIIKIKEKEALEKQSEIKEKVEKAISEGKDKQVELWLVRYKEELAVAVESSDRYKLEGLVTGFDGFKLPEGNDFSSDLVEAKQLLNNLKGKEAKIKELNQNLAAALASDDKKQLQLFIDNYKDELALAIIEGKKYKIEALLEGVDIADLPEDPELMARINQAKAVLEEINSKEETREIVKDQINRALKENDKKALDQLMENYREQLFTTMRQGDRFKLEAILEGLRLSKLPDDHSLLEDMARADSVLANLIAKEEKQHEVEKKLKRAIKDGDPEELNRLVTEYKNQLKAAIMLGDRYKVEALVKGIKAVRDLPADILKDLKEGEDAFEKLAKNEEKQLTMIEQINKAVRNGDKKQLEKLFVEYREALTKAIRKDDKYELAAFIEAFKGSSLPQNHELAGDLAKAKIVLDQIKMKEEKYQDILENLKVAIKSGNPAQINQLLETKYKNELVLATGEENRYILEAFVDAFASANLPVPGDHALSEEMVTAKTVLDGLKIKEKKTNEMVDKINELLAKGDKDKLATYAENWKLGLIQATENRDKYLMEGTINGFAAPNLPKEFYPKEELANAEHILEKMRTKGERRGKIRDKAYEAIEERNKEKLEALLEDLREDEVLAEELAKVLATLDEIKKEEEKLKRMKKDLQAVMGAPNKEKLTELLGEFRQLPRLIESDFEIISKAEELIKELEFDERRQKLVEKFQEMIEKGNREELEAVLEELSESGIPDKDGVLAKVSEDANKKLDKILIEEKIEGLKSMLDEAIKSGKKSDLEGVLEEYREARLSGDDEDISIKSKITTVVKMLDEIKEREEKFRSILDQIKEAIESEDVRDLEAAISAFKVAGIPDDDGYLERAEWLLGFAQTKQILIDGIDNRSLETLSDGLQRVENKNYESHLPAELVEEARVLHKRLTEIERMKEEIQNLKQSTVAEIRSYSSPPPQVHKVMIATYLILGVSEKETKEWKSMQALIGKTGKDNLKRRVMETNPAGISLDNAERVNKILDPFSYDQIIDVSLGAATFFGWAAVMVEEVRDIMNKKAKRERSMNA